MPHRRKLVVGNWKMHGSRAHNAPLLRALSESVPVARRDQVGVCVPFPYLAQAQELLSDSPLWWGAQDVSREREGAFTGHVSAAMLCDLGCRAVIVGHSERRRYNAESNDEVAAKAGRAIDAGLVAIVCVGESLAEREAGQTHAVVAAQLDPVLDEVGGTGLARLVLAYEPLWAIGTGKTATPKEAEEVHAALRARVGETAPEAAAGLTILYGGSVRAANAKALFGLADVDGGLVGGASLDAGEFLQIVAALPARDD